MFYLPFDVVLVINMVLIGTAIKTNITQIDAVGEPKVCYVTIFFHG